MKFLFKRFLVLAFAMLMICSAVACGDGGFSDDSIALARYLRFFDEPLDVEITKYDKYVFEDDQIIYNITWIDNTEGENEEIDLLLHFNSKSKKTTLCFWGDIEIGMHKEVKALWDAREEKAISKTSFNEKQIDEIHRDAVSYNDLSKEKE